VAHEEFEAVESSSLVKKFFYSEPNRTKTRDYQTLARKRAADN
jgi:hypothetical protein